MIEVSIIIAAYNVENYIRKCVDSCLEQTYSHFEIIIINDGSTDGTNEILNSYIGHDKLLVINKRNEGLVSARKLGIKSAHGDYVIFVDGDDYLPRESVENLVSGFDDITKPDIIVGKYLVLMSNGLQQTIDYGFNNGTKEELIESFFTKRLWNLWGNLYKLDLFKEVKFPEQLKYSIGEDLVTNVQLAYFSDRPIRKINRLTYCYVKRDGSILDMHSGSRVQIHSFKAFFLVWEFLKEKSYIEKIENSFIKVGAFFSLQYIRAVKNQNNPFDKEIRQFLKYLKVNMYKVYKLLGIKAVIFIFLAIMSITFTSRLLNVLKFK